VGGFRALPGRLVLRLHRIRIGRLLVCPLLRLLPGSPAPITPRACARATTPGAPCMSVQKDFLKASMEEIAHARALARL
jgi:hypothetical protein